MRYFISAFTTNNNLLENFQATNRLIEKIEYRLGILNPVQVLGVYKGIPEVSLMVESYDLITVELLKIAREFKQESILTVGDNDNAYLRFTNGDLQRIGKFEQANPEHDSTDHSIIDGVKYVIK